MKNLEPIGVVIGRFQTSDLHEGHLHLVNTVYSKHSEVVIFLGIPVIQNTNNNPLPFIIRKNMVQKLYPKATILPLLNQREDTNWSKSIDSHLKTIIGDRSAILYGSRDSFIPYYSGRHTTVELPSIVGISATEIRKGIINNPENTSDFRKGVIYGVSLQRPVSWTTVDITCFKQDGTILLAKKPNEEKYRFVGGFVDTTDESFEAAAKREFREETGGNCGINSIKYIASMGVKDWRYEREESRIITTLFLAEYGMGMVKATDDIEHLEWVLASKFKDDDKIERFIMEEHKPLMRALIAKAVKENLIPNL